VSFPGHGPRLNGRRHGWPGGGSYAGLAPGAFGAAAALGRGPEGASTSLHLGRRGEPHPEAHACRRRPIRSGMAANSWRGTATSASRKTTPLAGVTTGAPILTRPARQVARFSLRIDRGNANCRRAFARVSARANRGSRAAVSLKRRHDRWVHVPASFKGAGETPLLYRVAACL
jgi:hypothetical protein